MKTKIPPPIVLLVFGLAIYFLKDFFPAYSFEHLNLLSISLLAVGIGILVVAGTSFHKHETTVNPLQPKEATKLVVSGLYRFSRNPMYLGMLLMLFSVSLKFNLLGGLILCPLFMLYITKFQIIPEEEAMLELFHDQFMKYKKKTRRWL